MWSATCHGRLDLLEELLDEDPRRATAPCPPDEGPARLRRRPDRPRAKLGPGDRAAPDLPAAGESAPCFLLGNHEEVLLRILGGDAQLIARWRVVRRDRVSRELRRRYRAIRQALAMTRRLQSCAAPSHGSMSTSSKSFADSCRFRRLSVRPCRHQARACRSRTSSASPTFAGSASRSCSTRPIMASSSSTATPSPEAVDQRPNRIGIDTGRLSDGRPHRAGDRGAASAGCSRLAGRKARLSRIAYRWCIAELVLAHSDAMSISEAVARLGTGAIVFLAHVSRRLLRSLRIDCVRLR